MEEVQPTLAKTAQSDLPGAAPAGPPVRTDTVAPTSSRNDVHRTEAPVPRFIAISMPGKIEDVDNAIACVGGPESVRQVQRSDDGRLHLRLTRTYQFLGPMEMTRTKTSDLLVRAKRKEDGTWAYQVLGVLGWCFAVDDRQGGPLADFLFAPGPDLGYGRDSSFQNSIEAELLMGERGQSPGLTYMPPAFFTRIDRPTVYEFEDKAAPAGSQEKETEAGVEKTGWVSVLQVSFDDTQPVPAQPPAGAADQLRGPETGLVKRLSELFSQRPVWIKDVLKEHILRGTYNVTMWQKALKCVAYRWRDGPWRDTYIRLGWDPRQHPDEGKKLQVIDFRDRHFRNKEVYYQRLACQVQESSGQLDPHFRTPPVNKSQLYQLADIEDKTVQDILRSAVSVDKCSEKFGWLSEGTLKAIREAMAVKCQRWRMGKQGNSDVFSKHPALPAPADQDVDADSARVSSCGLKAPHPRDASSANSSGMKLRRVSSKKLVKRRLSGSGRDLSGTSAAGNSDDGATTVASVQEESPDRSLPARQTLRRTSKRPSGSAEIVSTANHPQKQLRHSAPP